MSLTIRRRRLVALWFMAAASLLSSAALGDARKLLLVDLDDEAQAKPHLQPGIKTLSTEHATVGNHSLKFTPLWYVSFVLDDAAMMKKLADYRTVAIDFFNPSQQLLQLYVTCKDELAATGKAANYTTGYCFLPPGKSTLTFSLTSLARQYPHPGDYVLDHKNLKSIAFTTGSDAANLLPPVVYYISNIRAEDSGVELPAVEGLKAFQLGLINSTGGVDGFTAITERTPAYPGAAGFGWGNKPQRFFSCAGNPDDLGNSALGGSIVVDAKPGQYVVHACIDPINEWGYACMFSSRTLKLCGKEVLSEKMDAQTFVKDHYCMFEDGEDTPATDLWNERVHKICPVRTFEATVGADGKFTIEYGGQNVVGGLCFFVFYPKEKAKEGAAWMAALDAIRKERFDARIVRNNIAPEGPAPEASADEKARGFVAFARSADAALSCASVPTPEEKGTPLSVTACPGERTACQLGLYPLAAVKGVTITASDLKGPGGAMIPASAIDLKKVRHFYKRFGNGPSLMLMPMVLQKFETLDLAPGFTRPVWITVKVGDKLPAGQYAGNIQIKSGGKSLDVPLTVTVNAFTLDAADDMCFSGMGTSAGFWRAAYPEASDMWWKIADQVMAMQAEHGFNALTGGPVMKLKAIKDGKAEIDFADADRWMELARKHGLTKLGDAYIGFDVDLGFQRDASPAGAQANDTHARAAYNMSFADLLKVAYGAVEQHAKDKNWSPRAYYLLDEPFGPAAVEGARVLIEACVKNAAGSKFSAYYAPSSAQSNTEAFYKLLPLSIMSSLTEPLLQTIHKAGNQTWDYANPGYITFENFRHLWGRWAFNAHKRGLDGVTGGFFFPDTVPYYEMSEEEGFWGVVFPSRDGMNSTVWFEKIAMGINDYRYLKTLTGRLDVAKKAGGKDAAVKDAQEFLADVDKACSLEKDTWSPRPLATPADFAALRQKAAKLIQELSK